MAAMIPETTFDSTGVHWIAGRLTCTSLATARAGRGGRFIIVPPLAHRLFQESSSASSPLVVRDTRKPRDGGPDHGGRPRHSVGNYMSLIAARDSPWSP